MNVTFERRLAKSLGTTILTSLQDVRLTIGATTYTRQEMIDTLGCGNFAAASHLTAVLKRLGVTTIAALYKLDPGSLARQRLVGITTLYVAMCVLDSEGYDIAKWWGWHQEKVVKFSTYKHRLLQRAKKRAA